VPAGVEATTDNGNLTLTGAVKFPSQRAAAESAVSALTGVRNVNDEIGFVFDVDPADVNRLVKEALDHHVMPPDDSHVVAATRGNTVTLVGHVRTGSQRDAVVAAAWRGHAVMAVIDELEVTG
jgi:osmotically-inducible protein OsmY